MALCVARWTVPTDVGCLVSAEVKAQGVGGAGLDADATKLHLTCRFSIRTTIADNSRTITGNSLGYRVANKTNQL